MRRLRRIRVPHIQCIHLKIHNLLLLLLLLSPKKLFAHRPSPPTRAAANPQCWLLPNRCPTLLTGLLQCLTMCPTRPRLKQRIELFLLRVLLLFVLQLLVNVDLVVDQPVFLVKPLA